MAHLIVSPYWFYGVDSLFEIIGMIVSLLIAYFSYKIYKYSSSKTYRIMSLAFFFIAISYFIKIITNTFIYFKILSFEHFVVMNQLVELNMIYTVGFVLLRVAFLMGLILLLSLALKINDIKIIFLLFFFSVITAAFSDYKYYIFHLTAAILLVFIARYFYKNYCEKRTGTSHCIFNSFAILAVANFIFMFVLLNNIFYVVGEVVQLVGYLVLLSVQVRVLKK
ncbi:MAG: hypothetical protein V1743_07225 [Nanoarchaeota archaeon]